MGSSVKGMDLGIARMRIVVAADNTPASRQAVLHGVRLCQRLAVSHELQVIHAVGLNPSRRSSFSLTDRLDRMNNLEMKDEAVDQVRALEQLLETFNGMVNYSVVFRQGEQSVQHILEEFINQAPPDMLIVGSSNKKGLSRWVLGSVSQYCVEHCLCPVMVVKNDPASR